MFTYFIFFIEYSFLLFFYSISHPSDVTVMSHDTEFGTGVLQAHLDNE